MNMFTNWANEIKLLISYLNDIDLGYPQGENSILPPRSDEVVQESLHVARATANEEFKLFYGVCDGISLPDVHVGYYIKSVIRLPVLDLSSEPIKIAQGDFPGDVLSFGSTGGGGLFVARREIGDVLHLAPGPLEDGIYDGSTGRVTYLSHSYYAFLERLIVDFRAFIDGDNDHQFIC